MGKKDRPEDFNPFSLSTKQALVLGAIGYQDSYGLQIAREIEKVTNGRMKLAMGSLYPILHALEEKGLVESYFGDERPEKRQGNRRRYYKLTGAGRRVWSEFNQVVSDWALEGVN